MQHNWNAMEKKMKPQRQISTSLFKWNDVNGNKYFNNYVTFETIGRGRFGKVKRCYQMYDSTLRSDKSLIVDEDILSQSLRNISFFESALVRQKRSKSSNFLDRLCSRETRIFAAKIVSKRLLKRIKTYQWNEKLKRMTTRSALDNIHREIQLMRHFTHENVVHLYDVVEDQREDKIYFIMEFMTNGECMRFDSVNRKFTSPITKTVLPEYLACRHITDILHGLRYLHNMGVAHCDLKVRGIITCCDD
uniref:Ser/thr kinase putative n=1 Tax=Albugo laibachii Nc14 TaxID=890382 RepID=F0WIL7_9STRA|nr:ser/thr kinase putative [Albugo laibachii Nc14]|eukprot:CCA21101.1 ser/thr kinase putative [Albugo laibachii Nc14]